MKSVEDLITDLGLILTKYTLFEVYFTHKNPAIHCVCEWRDFFIIIQGKSIIPIGV